MKLIFNKDQDELDSVEASLEYKIQQKYAATAALDRLKLELENANELNAQVLSRYKDALNWVEKAIAEEKFIDASNHAYNTCESLISVMQHFHDSKTKIRKVKLLLAEFNKSGGKTAYVEIQLQQAMSAFDNGEYAVSENLVNNAISNLTHIKNDYNAASKYLSNLKQGLDECQRRKIYISDLEKIYQQALDFFNQGEYRLALNKIKLTHQIIDARKGYYDNAKSLLSCLEKTIKDYKSTSIIIKSVEQSYDNIKRMFETGDYIYVIQNVKIINDQLVQVKNIYEHTKRKISEFESALRESINIQIENTDIGRLHTQSKKSFTLGNYAESIKEITMATDMFYKTKGIFDEANKQLSDLNKLIEQYKREKISLSAADNNIKMAVDIFKSGQYNDSIINIKQAVNNLNKIRSDYEQAKRYIADSENLQASLMQYHLDLTPVEPISSKMNKLFREGDYKGALDLSNSFITKAAEIRDKSKPDFIVAIVSKELKKGVWNKIVLKVKNQGNIDALNIGVDFSKDLEVKNPYNIPQINAKSEADMELSVRPKDAGNFPIDIKISYERPFDRKSFFSLRTIWIDVEGYAESPKIILPIEPKKPIANIPQKNSVTRCNKCNSAIILGTTCPYCK